MFSIRFTQILHELADLFLTNDQADLALEIIDGLDQASETRTDAFYRRRILVDILTSRQRGAEVAQESIERSRAYLQDGTPEIASILLAVAPLGFLAPVLLGLASAGWVWYVVALAASPALLTEPLPRAIIATQVRPEEQAVARYRKGEDTARLACASRALAHDCVHPTADGHCNRGGDGRTPC